MAIVFFFFFKTKLGYFSRIFRLQYFPNFPVNIFCIIKLDFKLYAHLWFQEKKDCAHCATFNTNIHNISTDFPFETRVRVDFGKFSNENWISHGKC